MSRGRAALRVQAAGLDFQNPIVLDTRVKPPGMTENESAEAAT